MLISRMATSGLSLVAFSTASRPFMASPTTVQPRRARRSPRIPRRTSSWSSATRIRSLFVPLLVICRYRHTHRGAAAAGFNIKLAAYERHSLVHARDADPKSKGHFPVPSSRTSGNSAAFVANLQRDLSGVTLNSYLGLGTSRMPLDVGETFLHHAEQSHLGVWLHPSETRRNLQFDFDSSSLREAARVMTNRIFQYGFVQHRWVQQIGKCADFTDALIRQSLALRSELAQPPARGRNGTAELTQRGCQRH